jgi:hypothetical protein
MRDGRKESVIFKSIGGTNKEQENGSFYDENQEHHFSRR